MEARWAREVVKAITTNALSLYYLFLSLYYLFRLTPDLEARWAREVVKAIATNALSLYFIIRCLV